MARQRFQIRLEAKAIIELDDAVFEAVGAEWRRQFYPLFSDREIAEHVGYNLIVNHANLSQLDGWADHPDEHAIIVEEPEWDTWAGRL